MPVPKIGELKFNMWNKRFVYGLPGSTEASVYVVRVNDIIIGDDNLLETVTAVSPEYVPTLEPFYNASGHDAEVLDTHPSQYKYRSRRVLPELNIWYSNTGGSTPKPKMVAQPDTRIIMECKEAARYRIFLGNDCSVQSGTCISGDPSILDVFDYGALTLDGTTFRINVGVVNLAMHVRDGEVVSVVYYDNTNNVIAIRPMRARLRGALQNTYYTNISGYAINSKFNSSTDYNFLDCRFTNIINRQDFGVRKFLSDGTWVDLPWNNTECTIIGLDAFLNGASSDKTDLILVDKSTGFSMTYHIQRGGDAIVDIPTGISPFDWNINSYDLVNGYTFYNGNERPEALARPVVIYPKGGWEVGARPTTLVFEGNYNGNNEGGVLGAVTVFDKAGNKISYNNSRSYSYSDDGGPNYFRSVVSLYYVGDVDIGGAIIDHVSTDMSVNKITRSGTFNKNTAQFGLQGIGGLLNYAIDLPNNSNELPLALANKRTINNELPIPESQSLIAVGGYPWHYGYGNKPTVSNIRYGEYLIPTYSDTAILDQGIEFLGRDIDFSANQYIIEAVFCLREHFTFDPELARPILEASSDPENVILNDVEVVVPVRQYVDPTPTYGPPLSPNPLMLPVYAMDPTNNVVFELPLDPSQLTYAPEYIPPGYRHFGMIFPNIAHPEEVPEDNVYMLAGVPPSSGSYMASTMSRIPKVGQLGPFAVHIGALLSDSLALCVENIPQNQPFFFSYWRTAGLEKPMLFTTGQRYTEATDINIGRSSKIVFDESNALYYGIHSRIYTHYSYVGNVYVGAPTPGMQLLGLGSGWGQGPSYSNTGEVPKSDGIFDHIVVCFTQTDVIVYCNKVAVQSYPLDRTNCRHDVILLGEWEGLNSSNQIPDRLQYSTSGLELYYGTPDQDFVDYLHEKTPYTSYVESTYVDQIFNSINGNPANPYFIKAQGEKSFTEPDTIYDVSFLTTTTVTVPAYLTGTPVTGTSPLDKFGNPIPFTIAGVSINSSSSAIVLNPIFDFTNAIANEDVITITFAAGRGIDYINIGTWVNNFTAPSPDSWSRGSSEDWHLANNVPTLYFALYNDGGIKGLHFKHTTVVGWYPGYGYSATTIDTAAAPVFWNGVYAQGIRMFPVTMVIDKIAGTLTVNVNLNGVVISDNITFAGSGSLTLTVPFDTSIYRFFRPSSDGFGDLFNFKAKIGRISVDEYNDFVNTVIDGKGFPFKGGIMEYDVTKRAYLEDPGSMLATVEQGSFGGAAMRYRNGKPFNDLTGIIVTTKDNPTSPSADAVLDKLSLTAQYGITEIEWRIKILSLPPQSQAATEALYLMEKHTDEEYSDGYSLTWGGGYYTMAFNSDVNQPGSGMMYTSPQSNPLNTWHTGKFVINGNTISFYLNNNLVSSETLDPSDALRIATDGPLRIGTSVANVTPGVLDAPTGTLGVASTDFDLDYLMIRQNGETIFNLSFGLRNYWAELGGGSGGGGGVPPPPPPIFTMKVGDNEIKVNTLTKRVSWINALEGLMVEPTADLLTILNRNIETINVITLVRKGPRAAMFINGSRVWYNENMDYDEDVGAQPIFINWGRTTEYGAVPYLQSFIVYSGSPWIDDALAPNDPVTIPVHDVSNKADYLRIDSTIINNVNNVTLRNIIDFNATIGKSSIIGDIIDGDYPWV